MTTELTTTTETTTTTPTPATPSKLRDERVRTAVHAGLDKKALGPIVLDTGALTSIADYFIILSGTSSRHVQSVSDEIEKKLREGGTRPRHIEGRGEGEWVLMDYGDFLVHIFTEENRRFYALERLWGDAPRINIE
jgi:ribosome-associated protein